GYGLDAKAFIVNPDQATLQAMTLQMPNARPTPFGNVNVETRATARSADSTYIVTDDPDAHVGHQTVDRRTAEAVARMQDEYIRGREMVVVEGFIGLEGAFRAPARLIIERSNANIAGMQDFLYYHDGVFREPRLTIIYTPNLPAPGYPSNRLILVDLEAGVTRILNSDYFGESKKSGLRMWNDIVYRGGGLPLHAGCKVIPVGDRERVMLIIGLSGTGKTTTTFTRQNNSLPVQDDFVALMPDGTVRVTENGCFAKTFGLSPETEPMIYRGVTMPNAYLENVSQPAPDVIDFHDRSYTENGRAVFPLSNIQYYDPTRLGPAEFFLILNRNDNIVPAVARLSGAQAAAYFMLGETQGTSAGGAAEMGKALRVPGTNPFFPLPHALQGNRFLEILRQHPMQVFLLNTGWVAGGADDPRAKKVEIRHSSAIVKAIAEETITWEEDPDFGYQVAAHVPGFPEEDADLLQPLRRYRAQGREGEYRELVARLKADRRAALERFPGLDPTILQAVG
ncbi:MAG TPA: phosphoenolpyruvate carboxykinase, partial [Dehalococcoidia bacterium]